MRHVCLAALILASAACGVLDPGAVGSGPTTPVTGTPGRPDAGTDASTPDGGTTHCPEDPDGAHLATVVLSEIATGVGGYLELANGLDEEFTLDGLVLSGAALGPLEGTLQAGDRATFARSLPRDGELGLREAGVLVQYVCWGVAPVTTMQNEAVSLGLWGSGLCSQGPSSGQTLHLRGDPATTTGWVSGPPSPRGCP